MIKDDIKVGGIPIRVIEAEALEPGRIVMITPELCRALYIHLLINGKRDGLPPGWDKERISENVVIIENVGQEETGS